ncbi:hypothetical protein OL229_05220 [Neisseriaceae bacterium JH1-16]|nr:hypothetical protein [Neisseriaceae bacterium JH1-16]
MSEQIEQQNDLHSPVLDALVADHEPVAAEAEGAAPAAELSNADSVAMGLELAVTFGKGYFPSLASTAPPEKCRQVGDALGAVLDKYGVQTAGWLATYGAELQALMVAGGFGVAVYAGIKADIAAREKEEAKPVPTVAPSPAGDPGLAETGGINHQLQAVAAHG